MLTLNDGRAELWQWDTGRTLTVDADCSQVHFSNKVFGRSIDVDVVGGTAIIPDVLLQTDKDFTVWAFVGTAENGYTKISKTFKVNRRNKPADYVFTPVEQTTIDEIAAIAQSVRDDADAGLFNGEPGDNGITPHIGDNGNWYLGDTDTGKPSRGEAGPAGADGKDGAGMDITGATVGQIAKISAVDESGAPTAWSPVDMPISFKPAGKSYLTFSSPNSFTLAVNDTTKHWDGTIEYFASDKTWTTWDGTTTLSSVDNDGEHVLYLRGTGNTKIGYYDYVDTEDYIPWVINGTDVRCNGNIETLLDYETVEAGQHPTMANECFIGLFKGCIALSQAPDLPATTLAGYCYDNMFRGCTALTKAPALPATTLVKNCYYNMFYGCISLTQAPELPATTLETSCYYGMFRDCTSLIQAPALPATTLANYCYSGMFQGCTSLIQVPELPATTLASRCYYGMFYGCTGLKLSSTQTGEYTQEYRIPSSGEGVTATNALTDMFASTSGTFIGTPAINKTYYLSSDNMIVRETEIATLNGYVESMIDVAIAEHTSNPLNITGATVGQIAKITAVDDSGKPTAWAPVDMPSGGGGETWELIAEIDFDVDVANDVSVWEYKNLPNYKELAYKKVGLVGSTETVSGLSISINDSMFNFSSIQYAKKGGQSNGWGKILLLPFGWIHVNPGSANLPTNHAFSGLQSIYNAIPFDGDSITSVKLSGHNTYKIAGGKLSLYGRR